MDPDDNARMMAACEDAWQRLRIRLERTGTTWTEEEWEKGRERHRASYPRLWAIIQRSIAGRRAVYDARHGVPDSP